MPAAPWSEPAPYAGTGWRVVEAQHRVSTFKLVDSAAEQALLETVLEDSKPRLPDECTGLYYLLATPFRYRPYPHGSRFRRAGLTPGVFYASEEVDTALAEMAFYRLLFFAESPGTPLPANASDYTAFSVALAVERALDVTAAGPPWTDPVNYEPCQALGEEARQAGVDLIRYRSVRDPAGRANLAVLQCRAFAQTMPTGWQSWKLFIGRRSVQALCDFPRRSLEFARAGFAADPRLS